MKSAVLCFTAMMFCATAFVGCAQEPAQPDLRKAAMERAQMVQIAKDAYVYGFPLVLTEMTKRFMTNPLQETGNVPVNQIKHYRAFADEKFNSFVRPNSDMFYSFAWLDLSKEPMLLEIPDTGKRYVLFTFFDGWSDVFAVLGKRVTGNAPQKAAVTGPNPAQN